MTKTKKKSTAEIIGSWKPRILTKYKFIKILLGKYKVNTRYFSDIIAARAKPSQAFIDSFEQILKEEGV